MNICKVKVLGEGKKGLEVSYLRNDEKNGYTFNNAYNVKYRYPLSIGIQTCLNDLQRYCKGLMRFDKDAEVEVTGVVSDAATKFIITYRVRTAADLYAGGSTPNVMEGNEYDKFDDVIDVIGKLYDYVVDYVEKGASEVEIKQYALRFNDDGIGEDDFDAMAETDKKDLMKRALEKAGCIVIDQSDIEDNSGFGDEEEEPIMKAV